MNEKLETILKETVVD